MPKEEVVRLRHIMVRDEKAMTKVAKAAQKPVKISSSLVAPIPKARTKRTAVRSG
jgi:hypothetical protein